MKIQPTSTHCRHFAAASAMFLALGLGSGACSSGDPLGTEAEPPLEVGPAQPGAGPGEEPASPDVPDETSAPGADPLSTPAENEPPSATETNLLTPPCRIDSDCSDGRRCIDGGRQAAGSSDGGADAGDSGPDAGGSASDAGSSSGRCERVDAG